MRTSASRFSKALAYGATSVSLLVAASCGEASRKQADNVQSTKSARVESSTVAVPADTSKAIVPAGPRIAADSLANDPREERTDNEFVVRLPSSMARVLFDSLPGFVPQPQAGYRPSLAKRPSAVSVVIGDFDGDSKRDIAMVGTSSATPVLIMLLAKSAANADPRLVFLSRPDPGTPSSLGSQYLEFVGPGRIASPDDKKNVLDLRTDAIRVIGENLAEIVYLDRGAVRSFSIRGD